MTASERVERLREKISDFWFAVQSDRRTIPCYRALRNNKRVLRLIDSEDGEQP